MTEQVLKGGLRGAYGLGLHQMNPERASLVVARQGDSRGPERSRRDGTGRPLEAAAAVRGARVMPVASTTTAMLPDLSAWLRHVPD